MSHSWPRREYNRIEGHRTIPWSIPETQVDTTPRETMPVSGDILIIVSGAAGLLVGAGLGYLLARSRQGRPVVPPQADHPLPADTPEIDETVRQLPLLLQELAARLEPNPAIQNKLAEIMRLVQAQAANIERIIRDARIDSLTGLWNRRALDEQIPLQLCLAQRYGTPLCVVMVDIDHFKQLNDDHGHAIGDDALQHVAALLRTELRESDFVARFGGEEFVLLLPQTDLPGALIATERIRQSIAGTPFSPNNQQIAIKVSVGIAQARRSDQASDLLARADLALLRAKQNGRNQIQLETALPL